MKARTSPSSEPNRSRRVNRSASAWHGCSRSVRALMTGISAAAAISSAIAWPNVRTMIPSTQRSRLRATSATLSRVPAPTSAVERWTAWPPSWVIPASKVTRVRRLGFWKSIARVRPASGWSAWRRVARNSALSSAARSKTSSTSATDRSPALSRSRPRMEIGGWPALPTHAPSGADGRRGQGAREEVSERTLRCVSERPERATPASAVRRAVSASCTGGPSGRASDRTSCAPSSAGRGSGGRPGGAAGGCPRDRAGGAPGRCHGGSPRPAR